MSRSRHHGCGRECGVCSPGGRGPDHIRQRHEERFQDAIALVEAHVHVPCGCRLWNCAECHDQCVRCGEVFPFRLPDGRLAPEHACSSEIVDDPRWDEEEYDQDWLDEAHALYDPTERASRMR